MHQLGEVSSLESIESALRVVLKGGGGGGGEEIVIFSHPHPTVGKDSAQIKIGQKLPKWDPQRLKRRKRKDIHSSPAVQPISWGSDVEPETLTGN